MSRLCEQMLRQLLDGLKGYGSVVAFWMRFLTRWLLGRLFTVTFGTVVSPSFRKISDWNIAQILRKENLIFCIHIYILFSILLVWFLIGSVRSPPPPPPRTPSESRTEHLYYPAARANQLATRRSLRQYAAPPWATPLQSLGTPRKPLKKEGKWRTLQKTKKK